PGQYVAIGMRIAVSHPDRVEVRATGQMNTGTSQYGPILPSGGFVSVPAGGASRFASGLVPDDSSEIRLIPWMRPVGSGNLDGTSMFIDAVMVALADTEQAALDQVAEFFDGDTP